MNNEEFKDRVGEVYWAVFWILFWFGSGLSWIGDLVKYWSDNL